MTEPSLRHITCAHPGGLHRLGYWEWGRSGQARTLICVHGLSRTGRDFDVLAQALCGDYRVICPDMPGRGVSDWLANPALYAVPQYVADLVTLVARLDVEQVDWIGTSMGGVIGMAYASLPGNPIGRLVLNDIGPEIAEAGRLRIAGYVGEIPTFDSFEEGEKYLRVQMADFGPHTDAQFRYLSRHFIVQRDGRWTFHYDPNIGVTSRAALSAKIVPDAWPLYDAIKAPTLVIRGSRSDLLSPETAQQMTQRGPKAQLRFAEGVGHAPTLITDDQIAIVREFLCQSGT